MGDEDLTAEHLRRRQRIERAEREQAPSEAEADIHRRRADKAAYLSEKLAEQERADRETEDADREADRQAGGGEG